MAKKRRLSPDEDRLRRLHTLGKKVQRAITKARGEKHTRYAPGAIVDLAQRMKTPASGLYKVARFAALYADDELKQLCALKSKDGKRLGVGHMYELILVPKTSDRTRLARQAASRGWSVRRLRAKAPETFPRIQEVSQGGPPTSDRR